MTDMKYINLKKGSNMDRIIEKLSGLGVASLLFVIVVNSTGYVGAAAITAALSAMGPGGMIGGITTFGVVCLVMEGITKYGIEKLLRELVAKLYIDGETKENILNKISKSPISMQKKLMLIKYVEEIYSSE